jgi:hypothetical protein
MRKEKNKKDILHLRPATRVEEEGEGRELHDGSGECFVIPLRACMCDLSSRGTNGAARRRQRLVVGCAV